MRILVFILVAFLLMVPKSWAKQLAPITKKRSLTLSLNNVRAWSRSGALLKSREGLVVTNPVDPYIVQIASRTSLINPNQFRRGEAPIVGKSFRVSFARGSDQVGYEVRSRLLGFVQTIGDFGDIEGVVITARTDSINGRENSSVSLSSNRAQSVIGALRELGLSEKQIFVDNIAEFTSSDDDEAVYDVMIIQ